MISSPRLPPLFAPYPLGHHTRRPVIRFPLSCLIWRLLMLAPLLSALPAGAAAEVGARRTIPLQTGWKFHFGDAPDAWRPAYNDQHWASVSVPHTWNAHDSTSPDFRRGTGWYRLSFARPAVSPGERIILDFRAVSLVATVWLNGHCLGSHDNGFAAFRFDTQDLLRADGENILVVRADTTWRDDLPPREIDVSLCGGIYREAALLITPAVAIDPLDHASSGVYLATPEVSPGAAKLVARIRVRNTRESVQPVNVCLALTNATGLTVGAVMTRHETPPGSSEARLEFILANPHRWHGRRDPYLYTATASVSADAPGGGAMLDAVSQPVGFRTFRIDPDRGFILNDEPYDLRGVNLHQERAERSWAVTPADREEDFNLMMELGCTFVRLVHYQHDTQAYALADRLGLVVWTEHALVNTVSENPLFAERCSTQLTELIRQNFNHPSIIFWGVGNEVQTHKPPAARRLLEILTRQAKIEDPDRLNTLATNYAEPVGAYGLDSIAHNQYHGWYHSAPGDFAAWLDGQRAKTPGRSLGMAEYGAGAGTSIHRATPLARDHSEEYQAIFHEIYWRTLSARPWVWCKAVWQMFDCASFVRNEGELRGINDKGLVTRDRRTRKDAFYWYQAHWTDAPMVHLTSQRFTPRTEAVTDVKVYSNCDTVELLLNGQSVGRRPVEDRIARWPGLQLEAGANRLEVIARRGEAVVRDTCTWTLASTTP